MDSPNPHRESGGAGSLPRLRLRKASRAARPQLIQIMHSDGYISIIDVGVFDTQITTQDIVAGNSVKNF